MIDVKQAWEWETKKEAFHLRLKSWDKKLSHLDDEVLHYIAMRAESILNFRAEKEKE